MPRTNRELWMAVLAITLISIGYLYVVSQEGSIPAASDFFGHSLGILGFLLMLMTETLYSLRKQSRQARWGRLASWLQFHIFTGLVGPYLVLLHTSWKFNGLAGVLTLLTVIIVASGFIGRYIYTAVPRTADGIALEAADLEANITLTEAELRSLIHVSELNAAHVRLLEKAAEGRSPESFRLIFGRALDEMLDRLSWWRVKLQMGPEARQRASQLERLLRQRRTIQRQIASLAVTRRMLAYWHAVHIPIGMALFTVAFIHILAAIYYATLLK